MGKLQKQWILTDWKKDSPWHLGGDKSRTTGVPKKSLCKKHETCTDPISADPISLSDWCRKRATLWPTGQFTHWVLSVGPLPTSMYGFYYHSSSLLFNPICPSPLTFHVGFTITQATIWELACGFYYHSSNLLFNPICPSPRTLRPVESCICCWVLVWILILI